MSSDEHIFDDETSIESGGPRTIRFKTYYWSYEEDEDRNLVFHIAGKTAEEKSVHLIVKGFHPFVYLELPRRVRWNKAKCIALFDYFQKTMKSEGPLEFKMIKQYLLKYKKLVNTMRMTFPNNSASRFLERKCSNKNGLTIEGLGFFKADEFVVHEQNIDPILKFTAMKDINLAGWLEVKETIPLGEEGLDEEERRYSTADIDFYARWEDVNPYIQKEIVIVRPKYFSFDIECNSKNHNSKLPDPTIPENYVFQIGCTIGRFGESIDKAKSYLLTFGNPLDVKGVTMVRFNNGTNQQKEKALLMYFKKLIEEENPDVMIGYNIMKFDWNYMIVRADIAGIYDKFALISRIVGSQAEKKKAAWSSSAYGEQEFVYLDPRGRTNVDVMIEIERNYKLPQYGLNAVSEFFLGEQKDPVSARQLFMVFQLTDELSGVIEELPMGTISKDKRIEIKKEVQNILQMRRCSGEIKKLRTDLMNAKKGSEFKTLIRKGFSITGKYCVQDTVLPVKIAEKLNLWITMEEMSNCMNVPMSYLHTRGQQVKVMAQIYRETIKHNIIIPYRKKQDIVPERYQGAMVIEANPGDYENVVCYDFESLYPTTIIAFNICYTTLLEENDPTPDEECHVLEWSDHVACLIKGTPISLENRSFPIETLEKYRGNILSWEPNKKGIVKSKQTNFFNRGIKECVRITLEDGSYLECTPDHRLLNSQGQWVEAQDLKVCEERVKTSYMPPSFQMGKGSFVLAGETYTGDRLFKLMSLLGLICSDGYNSDHHTLVYLGHALDVENVGRVIRDLFHKNIAPRKQNYGWSFTIPGIYGTAIRKLEGMMKHKKSTQTRSLPSFLKTANKGMVASFLSGLFGGDGHTFTFSSNAQSLGTIGFSWTSEEPGQLEEVFSDIQGYLGQFDIKSGFSRSGNETCLHVRAEDTLKFKDIIGFSYCVHKAARLEAGCKYLRLRNNVWEQQKWLTNRVRELKEKTTVKEATLKAIEELKSREPIYNDYYATPSASQMVELLRPRRSLEKPMFSRSHFPGPVEFLESIDAASLFKAGNYGVDKDSDVLPTFNLKVIKIESIGLRETYDLEVEDTHSFIANGFVVHNCEHDPLKRKKKKEEILCKAHRYRFRKVVTLPDGTRQNEGLMPKLERKLLTDRKARKREMAKLEATLKMATKDLTEEDLAYYKKMGWPLIKKGSLTEREIEVLKVGIVVMNAQQLTLKVSANSAYGGMGAQNGFAPLVPGAASVCAMGRMLIMAAIKYVLDKYSFSKLVYGDTDSAMMAFTGKDTFESFELGDRISREVSHFLKTKLLGFDENYQILCPTDGVMYRVDKYPRNKMKGLEDEKKVHLYQYDSNPINLNFENLYKRYFLLSKKRYVAYAVNRKGEVINTIKKGVVLARRDNSQYLRDTYKAMVTGILDRSSEQEVMYILYDQVNKLFTRQIPDANLIVYTGVKSIMNYAKKKETKNGRTVTNRVFLDEYEDPLHDEEINGPLDPRLVYPNLPQVLLTLKMLKRGDDVPANTRLEYLYLEHPNAEHQGEKAEDYTYYRENKDIYNFRPDCLHYVEKQLAKPITEALEVKYKHAMVPYENIEDALVRVLDLEMFKGGMDELFARKVKGIKKYEKVVESKRDTTRCGWEMMCKGCKARYPKRCGKQHTDGSLIVTHNPKVEARTYHYKNKFAQVEFILESVARKKANPKLRGELDERKCPEVISVCRRWKAWHIVNAFHDKFGMKKRTAKRPTQTGEKLRLFTKAVPVTKVLLTDIYMGFPRNSLASLKAIREEEDENSIKKKKNYFYTLEMKNGTILEDVPRSAFTTFYYKDSCVVKDILLARGKYKCVVGELNGLFDPIDFGDVKEIKTFELPEEVDGTLIDF